MKRETIKELKTVYHQIVLLNCKFKAALANLKASYDTQLGEKLKEYYATKEKEFAVTSEYLTLRNLLSIEQTLSNLHSRLAVALPKLAEAEETLPCLLRTVTEGMDRLFLEDNLICDEKMLSNSIAKAARTAQMVLEENKDKFELVGVALEKVKQLQMIVKQEEEALFELENRFSKFRDNSYAAQEETIADGLKAMNDRLWADMFN